MSRSVLITLLATVIGVALLITTSPVQAATVNQDTFVLESGKVSQGDLYISGNDITIDGTVDGDLVAVGQTIHLGQDALITGSVLAAAQQITMDGKVEGSVRTLSNTLTISGSVAHDVTSLAPTLQMRGGSRIGGNVYYISQNPTISAAVEGEIRNINPTPPQPTAQEEFYRLLQAFLALSLAGVILYTLQPAISTEELWEPIKTAFPRSLLYGFLLFLCGTVLATILVVTVVGRWVGIALFLLTAVAFLFGAIDAAYAIGRFLLGRRVVVPSQTVLIFLLGAAIMVTALQLPILSLIIGLIWLAAAGARFRHLLQPYLQHRQRA